MKNKDVHYFNKIGFIVFLVSAVFFTITGCSKENNLSVKSISGFNTVDIEGNAVTADYLQENEITLVNVMTTTSESCIEDLKSLGEISKELNSNVGFLCLDIDMDMHGDPEEESLKILKKVYTENKSKVKIIYPDEILMDNVLMNLGMIPCTFFVDKNGNVIGKSYFDNNSKKEWIKIIKSQLK